MAEKRELEYKDTFVLYLLQTLSDRFDAEPDFPTLPFTDLTTRKKLTVEVNAREYTQILSAIMTGADLAFPDMAHELELIWTYAKEAVMDTIPVGTIMAYTSVSVLPDKWLFCNGDDISQATYPVLYALIGTAFGTPVAGLFTLPNLAHRFPLGESDPITGKPAIGAVGGEEFHTLTIFEIPPHTHSIAKGQAVAAQNARSNQSNNTALADQQTGSTGGGAGHNNMPPYLALAWIIKALP